MNSLPPSPEDGSTQVFAVLSQSRARLERSAELGDALRLAQWRNEADQTSYRQPGHHTLSVYLQGGHDTHRRGHPQDTGAPGRYCLLPAEHESEWQIRGPLRFVHLYVSDIAWADRVVRLLDAEPRAITLEERIFGEDPRLSDWAARIAGLAWQDQASARLHAHQLSHAALDHLVLQAARPRAAQAALRTRGGLSGPMRRRVLEFVEQHLAEGPELLGLSHLAALVNLSEFHFARMFRLSMGCSVHAWISQRRLARAEALLLQQGQLPLAQIAADCGFASASHLSHRFKALRGVSPALLRRLATPA
ncbi:AraC family transcriptional regulator [Paucibacter sp. KBW04]|uniref:AraC family transcriptional regulator n=1 Tax=Paucibacter sp. KBW04 TaxID=2153361 RepID=UPI001E53F7F7|nr:AraC family transcriptional regulator [Paucibacter sp. KBW04]